MSNDMDKIGTKKAQEEREAQIEMAREAHNQIFGKKIGEQALLAEEEPNWALFNYIMQIVDFTHCKNMQDALHTMYRNLWPHIKRYHNEREELLKEISESEECNDSERFGISPLEMATKTLQAVSEAAKNRSRNNIYVPKKKLTIVKE